MLVGILLRQPTTWLFLLALAVVGSLRRAIKLYSNRPVSRSEFLLPT